MSDEEVIEPDGEVDEEEDLEDMPASAGPYGETRNEDGSITVAAADGTEVRTIPPLADQVAEAEALKAEQEAEVEEEAE